MVRPQVLYFYTVNLTVPPHTSRTTELKVSADADFIVKRISISATSLSSRILITDTSSTARWFNAPLRLDHLAGNYAPNSRPNSLFTPQIIRANNTITITITNDIASPNIVALSFEGFRQPIVR